MKERSNDYQKISEFVNAPGPEPGKFEDRVKRFGDLKLTSRTPMPILAPFPDFSPPTNEHESEEIVQNYKFGGFENLPPSTDPSYKGQYMQHIKDIRSVFPLDSEGATGWLQTWRNPSPSRLRKLLQQGTLLRLTKTTGTEPDLNLAVDTEIEKVREEIKSSIDRTLESFLPSLSSDQKNL